MDPFWDPYLGRDHWEHMSTTTCTISLMSPHVGDQGCARGDDHEVKGARTIHGVCIKGVLFTRYGVFPGVQMR